MHCGRFNRPLNRREMLLRCANGFGAVALAALLAEEEAHVLLFEPASTLNTGNVRNERTVAQLERI